MNTTIMRFALTMATVLFGSLPVCAQASSYSFTCFGDGCSYSPASNLGSQLTVNVSDYGATVATNDVTFTFTNAVGMASSITDIYFDNGTTNLLSSLTILAPQPAGVDFSVLANPGNVPGANAINFSTDLNLSADSNPPTAPNGVNTSTEYITFVGTLTSGKTLADLYTGIQAGGVNGFRMALHVQAIGDESKSAAYVNAIPEPETYAMLLAGLGLVGFAVRRKLA